MNLCNKQQPLFKSTNLTQLVTQPHNVCVCISMHNQQCIVNSAQPLSILICHYVLSSGKSRDELTYLFLTLCANLFFNKIIKYK